MSELNGINYVKDKVVIITGASSGFGLLTAKLVAARGGKPVLAARNEAKLKAVCDEIKADGGECAYIVTDVSKEDDVNAMAKFAVDTYGRIDVLVNNAGTMPLAFFSDHKAAMQKWMDCIDISIKGTIYGISAVYDQMIAQGKGQIINVSSIYGNFPVEGANVYQVAKAGVEILGESLRKECLGKIKVTIIKPTGFLATNLKDSVVNPMAAASCQVDVLGMMEDLQAVDAYPDRTDIDSVHCQFLDPQVLAENIVYAIDQPWGISVGNITVRASGDAYCL